MKTPEEIGNEVVTEMAPPSKIEGLFRLGVVCGARAMQREWEAEEEQRIVAWFRLCQHRYKNAKQRYDAWLADNRSSTGLNTWGTEYETDREREDRIIKNNNWNTAGAGYQSEMGAAEALWRHVWSIYGESRCREIADKVRLEAA